MDLDELVPQMPLDVSCPACDSDDGQPCREPRFGQEGVLLDFHDSRWLAVTDVEVCPSCRSEDVDTQHGTSESLGDWSVDGCHDCGWVGQTY